MCYLAESLDFGRGSFVGDNFFVVVISSRFAVCDCLIDDYLDLIGA